VGELRYMQLFTRKLCLGKRVEPRRALNRRNASTYEAENFKLNAEASNFSIFGYSNQISRTPRECISYNMMKERSASYVETILVFLWN